MKITLSNLRQIVKETLSEIDPIQVLDEKEGKKDACYYKVKSRYKVWPSAYASGALVKCRKVGAKNWGNKSKKKESVEHDFLRQLVEEEVAKLAEKKTNPRIPRKKGQKRKSKKHSDLYTDEDPKGTIHGLKFATEADAKKSVTKIRNSSRSHAHKVQAAVAMEQRAKAAGKASAAAVYRKYINSVKKDESLEDNTIEEKKRKLTKKPSSETSLRDWFKRKGAKGSKSGWVDCNTCRKDKKTGRKKCSACGRSGGEKRSKYPKCRPTPAACGERGDYGKKSKAGKKG
tara:strand:- start:499 stop:1359 length:861 start_codon:yes stop_codon:yes gene_type:complete